MDEDGVSLVSVQESACRDLSMSEEEMEKKLKYVHNVITMIQSRLIFMSAMVNREKQGCTTSPLDVTTITKDYKKKKEEYLQAVEELQLKSRALKMIVFSIRAQQLMATPGTPAQVYQGLQSVPDILSFKGKLKALAIPYASALEEQQAVCHAQVTQLQDYMATQNQVIDLIAATKDKLEKRKQEKKKPKPKTVLKIKIARAVINCVLSKDIDFELQPQLLELKIKYRPPVHL